MTPTPFYDEGGITIYHGDCREILPHLKPAGRPDLLILDPPFTEWEHVEHVDARTVLAFTSWQHRHHAEALYGRPRTEVVWHFLDGRWVSHHLPITTHATILVWGELNEVYVGEEQDQTPRKIAAHSHMPRMVSPRTQYVPRPRKALTSVLIHPHNPTGQPLGRWSKPVPVVRQLVEWAAMGPYLLDPFMGAGTSLRVAKDLGMRAVGIDLEERHCQLAVERLAQEVLTI
jgi:site-specific DNA-methyltransferase (adenine-specific)